VKDLVFGTEDGTMTGKRLLNTKSRPHRNEGVDPKLIMKHSIMLRWDAWRKYYDDGGRASWPRDEFEALIDDLLEVRIGS